MTAANYDLNDTFQACIEAIEQEQATIEECIARYPDVPGLEDMLRTVRAVDRLSALKMPAAQKDAIAQQLALRINQQFSTPRPVGRPSKRISVTFALAACLLVVFFVGLLFVAGHSGLDNAAKPASTAQPTYTPTQATITLDALRQKTQDCLINPRFYTSLKVKLNINQLRAFINEVKAQSGKKLKAECANELIDMATRLMNK